MTGSQIVGQVVHLLIRLLLARLLAPEQFGLMAMALIFVSFSEQFLDLGLAAALIQRPRLREHDRSTAFWCTWALGCGSAVVLIVIAPVAAAFFQAPTLTNPLRVVGLSLAFSAPGSIFQALLQRDMRFRALGIRQIAGILAGGVAGIGLAALGAGVWALVAEQFVRTVVGTLALVLQSSWLPSPAFSLAAMRELWWFGKSILGSRFFNYFNRNLDNLLVGRFLGAPALGLYAFSYQAVLMPLQYLARPLAQVGLPILAKLQDQPGRAGRIYLRLLEVVVAATWPLAALTALAAPEAIPLLLGERWIDGVLPFQLFCPVAMLQSPISLIPTVFTAFGRPDLLMRWTAVILVANALGFSVGLLWGVEGVVIGYLIAVLLMSPVHIHLTARTLGLPLSPIYGVHARGTIAVLALVFGWQLAAFSLPSGGVLADLALRASISLAAFGGASLFLLPNSWEIGRQSLAVFRRKRGEPPVTLP